MRQDLLPFAFQYAAQGWPVFCLSGSKVPFKGSQGHLDATTDPDLIRAMWIKHPGANIGMATGSNAGVIVADADGPGGLAQLQALAAPHGGLPVTLTSKTSRGWHFFYGAPGRELRTYNSRRSTKGTDGLDIKADGGYVVLAPSRNPKTGVTYRWANSAGIAPIPDWLVAWVDAQRAPRPANAGQADPALAGLGERPAWLSRGAISNRINECEARAELPELVSALKCIDAACGYDEWFETGASLHHFDPGPIGLAIFEAWSKSSNNPKHVQDVSNGNCAQKWAEYAKPKPGKRLRTVASIYDRAKQNAPPSGGINGTHALPAALMGVAGTPIRWADTDEDGHPRATCTNAGIAIENLGVACRKDVFHEKMIVGGRVIQQWAGDLSDDVIHMLRKIIKRTYRFDPGEKNARDASIQLCLENQFNPVTEYLTQCQAAWDGRPRIGRWVVDYLGSADTALNREIGRLMLVAAARRARQPGCKFDQIIVMEGQEGTGKSSAIKILAGEENFSDQHILGASDKEQQEAACGVWLHEIAELAGMRRTDVERTKQFASRTEDRARPAYGRIRVDMKRRGILIATTNEDAYLKSDTGNRRFWPIDTGRINLKELERDRDQLWGEAAQQETGGTSLILNTELWRYANESQKDRLEPDAWEDMVVTYLNVSKNQGDCSLYEIMIGPPFNLEAVNINQFTQNRIARILLKMGWERYRKRDGAMLSWRYRVGTPGTPGTPGTK